MPYTELTVQTIGRGVTGSAALTPSYSAVDAANGNYFDNAGRNNFIHIKNNSGGNLTVTINVHQSVDADLVVPDLTVVIANGEERILGAFPSSPYENSAATPSSAVEIDWSTGTSVTAGVFKLPSAQLQS